MKISSYLIILILSFTTLAHGQEVTMGLKNFRSIYYSMQVVTNVQPTQEIKDYYISVVAKLPKDGRVDEISSPMLLAVKGLAGLFCKEMTKPSGTIIAMGNSDEEVLQYLSQKFYSRPLSPEKLNIFKDLYAHMSPDKNKVFVACTVMLSSSEFLVVN